MNFFKINNRLKQYIKTVIMLFMSVMPMSSMAIMKDPFQQQQTISCEALSAQMIDQISQWQYRGILRPASVDLTVLASSSAIWLTDQSRWIRLLSGRISNNIPDELSPWQLISVSDNEIKWQVTLPQYCDTLVSYTMDIREQLK